MIKATTKQSYRQRLTRVIDYIHDNIHGKLDVNTLADIAFMSPYHFHRIYRELAHETVNATVRRIRLQQSAADLIRTDLSVADIAKTVSYGSTEAFTRAFTKQFGISPSLYRESKQRSEIHYEPFVAMLPTDEERYKSMSDNEFTVDITTIDTMHLAGYSHQGDYLKIGASFEKLSIEAEGLQLFNQSTRFIGVYYDDPDTVKESELRSMACITVEKKQQCQTLERLTVPSGTCASILFQGPYAELEKPYQYLFGHWLPNSGHELLDFPCFEEYINDPKTTPPNQLLTRIFCLLEP